MRTSGAGRVGVAEEGHVGPADLEQLQQLPQGRLRAERRQGPDLEVSYQRRLLQSAPILMISAVLCAHTQPAAASPSFSRACLVPHVAACLRRWSGAA